MLFELSKEILEINKKMVLSSMELLDTYRADLQKELSAFEKTRATKNGDTNQRHDDEIDWYKEQISDIYAAVAWLRLMYHDPKGYYNWLKKPKPLNFGETPDVQNAKKLIIAKREFLRGVFSVDEFISDDFHSGFETGVSRFVDYLTGGANEK